MNVRLYKVTCYEAYQMREEGTGFSLEPWGHDTEFYKGFDDGGREYALPEGCEIERLEDGSCIRWNGNQADVVNDHGRPMLVSVDGMEILREA